MADDELVAKSIECLRGDTRCYVLAHMLQGKTCQAACCTHAHSALAKGGGNDRGDGVVSGCRWVACSQNSRA